MSLRKYCSVFLLPLLLTCAAQASQASSLLDRGEELFKQANYNEAFKLFDQAVREQPDDAFAYSDRGMTLHALGKSSQALAV